MRRLILSQYGAVIGSLMTLGLGLGWSESARAEFSSSELIVRSRQALSTETSAQAFVIQALGDSAIGRPSKVDTRLLNEEEGLIRLRFSNPAQAEAAQKILEFSDEVTRVTRNALYAPAIHWQVRDAEIESAYSPLDLSESLFSFIGKKKPAPDVQFPSGPIVAGEDPLANSDWALKGIRMPRADAFTPMASDSIIAAVIDTGVDYNHEDLIHSMWRNPDNDREVGYDFAHDNAKPFDIVQFDMEGCRKSLLCKIGVTQGQYLSNPGHGTHCAGHVAAGTRNSLGIRGVGAGARLMALKFFYDVGDWNAGRGDDAAAIRSIDYAIKRGAKVISASWGGRMPRPLADRSELKEALIRAQKAGVLVVVAAGNDGVDQDNVSNPDYPAAYDLDNLIVVAASDQQDRLASFSNYGAKSVHIAAPGVKILSTTSGGSYSDIVVRYKDEQGNQKEVGWDGTSMATPIVAGAVARVWLAHPTFTYGEVRERILKSARHVDGLEGKVSTGGVLDVEKALSSSR